MRARVGTLVAGMFLVGLAGAASAEDGSNEGPNFTFGASTSYVYDFNDPDGDEPTGLNPASYANLEDADEAFNIDLVQLGINGSRGNASYGAKVEFGDLAALTGDSADGDVAVHAAYLSYDFGGAAATAGRWDTPIGYEVMEPWGNSNVSRSYSWTLLQPINHDGLFVSGNAGIFDGMIGVANGFTVADGANGGINDLDDEKAVVGAVGAGINEAFNLYFSMIYTEEQDITDVQLYNAIVSGDVDMGGNGFRYAVEGNYSDADTDEGSAFDQGQNTAWSVVGYAGADFGPTSLDARGEYLDLDSDPDFGGDASEQLWNISLTAGWYLTDGMQFRLEYRHDASDNFDQYGDDNSSGSDDSLDTLQAQLVWYPEL